MKKICTKCKNEKELESFSLHPKGKFGRHPQCNECRSEFERLQYLNGTREKRKQNRPYTYERQLKDRYNISLVTYNEMLSRQKSCCAICGEKRKLVVDHDHTTKIVRGLLCTKCNTGLGKFNDNLELLNYAIKYLEG